MTLDIVQCVAVFLDKRAFCSWRCVARHFGFHPRIIAELQKRQFSILSHDEPTASPAWAGGIKNMAWNISEDALIYGWGGTNYETPYSLVEKYSTLQKLYLDCPDHFLEPLSKLTALQDLTIDRYQGDIVPLSRLTNLKELRVYEFWGPSLVPLSSLTNLQTLRLSPFSDNITLIGNLTNLQELSLGIKTGDLSPVSGLTKLEILSLHYFNGDITPLSGLTNLQELKLPRNHPNRHDWRAILFRGSAK